MLTITATPTIREATPADAPQLLTCLLSLAWRSRYTRAAKTNSAHLSAMLDRLLANPDAGFVIAEAENGSIIGLLVVMLYDHLISGERGASEVCWWVEPEHRHGIGVELLACAEAWARMHDATWMQMLAPETKFETLYRRRGYVLTDRVYERRL